MLPLLLAALLAQGISIGGSGSTSSGTSSNVMTLVPNQPIGSPGQIQNGNSSISGSQYIGGNQIIEGVVSGGQGQFNSMFGGTGPFTFNLGSTPPTQVWHQQGSMRLQFMADPAAPLIANIGTAGAVTVAYFVRAVDRFGNRTNVSAGGSTTTSQAFASLNTANFNLVQWTNIEGAYSYEIFRTTAGSTLLSTASLLTTYIAPRTSMYDQGQFNSTASTWAQEPSPRNYSADAFIDGTVFAAALSGPITVAQIPTPTTPVATFFGTGGATTYTYAVACVDRLGNKTRLTAFANCASANATINGSNLCQIVWPHQAGCASYDVVKTNATGVFANIPAIPANPMQMYQDRGAASTVVLAGSYTQVARNTTGDLTVSGNLSVGGSAYPFTLSSFYVNAAVPAGATTFGGTVLPARAFTALAVRFRNSTASGGGGGTTTFRVSDGTNNCDFAVNCTGTTGNVNIRQVTTAGTCAFAASATLTYSSTASTCTTTQPTVLGTVDVEGNWQ